MFAFALSLFDVGLMVTVAIFILLYVVVLIKLKPAVEVDKITKTKSAKQNIRKSFFAKLRKRPKISHQKWKDPPERIKTLKRSEPAGTSTKAKKTEISGDTQQSACPHHFGYLKEHPKNTPIPNECLTCANIMKCLVGV